MVIQILILAIAAIEIVLAVLVLKTLWGPPVTHEPPARTALAMPHASTSARRFGRPAGTQAR